MVDKEAKCPCTSSKKSKKMKKAIDKKRVSSSLTEPMRGSESFLGKVGNDL